jgi:hypothetical protein
MRHVHRGQHNRLLAVGQGHQNVRLRFCQSEVRHEVVYRYEKMGLVPNQREGCGWQSLRVDLDVGQVALAQVAYCSP